MAGMQAGDVTLKNLFSDNHRYEIPMFQRPYVWAAEREWGPLWDDISAAADGVVAEAAAEEWPEEPPRYFLGSIVIKEIRRSPKRLGGSLLVDGQQRLTTLQVLLTAALSVAAELGADSAVGRFNSWLTNNADAVHEDYPDDRYKLWPLPQDRKEYLWAVRDLGDDAASPDPDHQIAKARLWFEEAIRAWAGTGPDAADRLEALHSALQDRMQVALITLEKTDNAQVIFEALNHRGVELSQSDLIKNLLFRLVEDQGQRKLAESLLVDHWLPLDAREWRTEVTTGRIQRNLLDLVLTYWLTIRTEEVVSVEHLYDEFKIWLLNGDHNAAEMIKGIRRHADLYHQLTTNPPDAATAQLVDHITATKTNTVWPLLLSLFSQERAVSTDQRGVAVSALSSYLMRRGVCGWTTKDYNRAFVSVLKHSQATEPARAGDAVRDTLAKFTGESRVWPDDTEFFSGLLASNFYALPKPRIRAFLAGVENYLRGALADQRSAVRATDPALNIEHVLPQSWSTHWPLPPEVEPEDAKEKRERAVNAVGNLTLTNGKLNSKLRNAGWLTKRPALQAKSTLLITTASILAPPPDQDAEKWPVGWSEQTIDARTLWLVKQALLAWPRPEGTVPDEERWDDTSYTGATTADDLDADETDGEFDDDLEGTDGFAVDGSGVW